MRGSRAAGGVLSSGAPAQAGRRRRRRAGASAQKGRPGRRAGPLCEQGLARGKQVHFVACAPAGGGVRTGPEPQTGPIGNRSPEHPPATVPIGDTQKTKLWAIFGHLWVLFG